MQAVLIGTGGTVLGRAFPLDTPLVTIGRHRENAIVTREPTISRRHAEIRREGDEFIIVDLQSATGIVVNGQPVRGEQRLRDGDRISIGRATVFVIQVLPAADRVAEPAPDLESKLFTLPLPPNPAGELNIPIDSQRRQEQVEEIMESEFFRNLRASAERRRVRPPQAPTSKDDPA